METPEKQDESGEESLQADEESPPADEETPPADESPSQTELPPLAVDEKSMTELVTSLQAIDNITEDGSTANVQLRNRVSQAPRPRSLESPDYDFDQFATQNFQGSTPYFTKSPLKVALLPLDEEEDQLAAKAIWIVLLCFMRDLTDQHLVEMGDSPVMTKIYTTLGHSFNAAQGEQEDQDEGTLKKTQTQDKRSSKSPVQAHAQKPTPKKGRTIKKLMSLTFKKRLKTGVDDVLQYSEYGDKGPQSAGPLLQEKPSSDLEKIHFVMGHGIMRPELRDEIYCQLCKLINNNPKKKSQEAGWIMMTLATAMFPPSQRFLPYLRSFILRHKPGHVTCDTVLSRTLNNGARSHPPTYLEYKSYRMRETMTVPVTTMDESIWTLEVDSATTAAEVCQQISDKMGIKDPMGFSLYISLYDKVSSMGSGKAHLLDGVCQCELYARKQGVKERHAPWRLFFRKEYFSPWHDPLGDPVANGIIYHQILRGIRFLEYFTNKEEDLVEAAAKHYYVEIGGEIKADKVPHVLNACIPERLWKGSRAQAHWVKAVTKMYKNNLAAYSAKSADEVRGEVVIYAMRQWPLLFSSFYEAFRYSGPPLPQNDVLLAINWQAVNVVDGGANILVKLEYEDIMSVTSSRAERTHGRCVTFNTKNEESYTFTSTHAHDIEQLVSTFQQGVHTHAHRVAINRGLKPENSDSGKNGSVSTGKNAKKA